MFGTQLLLIFLLPVSLILADNYHPDPPEERSTVNLRRHPEENAASYWKLQAQTYIFHALNKKTIQQKAKNIILFIGDGMDMSTIAATRMHVGSEDGHLFFESLPSFGLAKTYCVDSKVADSACTATAYLSGVKTNYGVLGVNANIKRKACDTPGDEENHVPSIAKWAQDAGKKTGIVTTAKITDASPGGVYAHISEREWETNGDIPSGCEVKYGDVAHQLVHGETGRKLNVILGCGSKYLLPKEELDEDGAPGKRTDGRNLVEEWKKLQSDAGLTFEYVHNRTKLLEIPVETERVFGVFNDDHCRYQLDIKSENLVEKPTLTDMTETALKLLEQHKEGFFLFVEGARIDHAHHDNVARHALEETAEFDRAIKRATELIDLQETLIVVSADHGHTFMYSGYATRGSDIFGLAGTGGDNLPYSILSYANGRGYRNTYNYAGQETETSGGRKDLREQDMTSPGFEFPATVPRDSETHGGADVGVWAHGPFAHLFIGVNEQSNLPLFMAYAAKIGPYKEEDTDDEDNDEDDDDDGTGSSKGLVASTLMLVVCLLIIL